MPCISNRRPAGIQRTGQSQSQVSCRTDDLLNSRLISSVDHHKGGSGGSGGGGASGASDTKGASKSRKGRSDNEKSGNGNSRSKVDSKRSQSDTACWSCSTQNASWICSQAHDGCKIRYCCRCARCPCKGNVPCDPALESTQFHCPLCRAMWGLPPVPQFGWTNVCFTCPSKSKETVNCVICHKGFCLECASAVSARTDYSCLICSRATMTKGMINGRRAYMESLQGGF